MAVDGPVRAPELSAYNNFAQQRKEEEEKAKKDAWKKELKRRRKVTEDRMDQRRAVFGYSGNPGMAQDNDPSIASKMRHMGSMDPNVLAGEIIALFIIQFFQSIFQTQYLIQKREYNDALALDEEKEFRIASGLAKDDDIRVAYQPLRKVERGTPIFKADGTQEVFNGKPLFNAKTTVKTNPDGTFEYPAIYPVDGAGNVDYNQEPNTDGTADRHSIRANGYVPIEDWQESHEIQWLWFQKEMSGSGGFNAEQRSKLGISIEQGKNKAKNEGPDSAQQFAVRPGQGPAPTPTPKHK